MGLLTHSWFTEGTIIFTIIITAYFYMTRSFRYWKNRSVAEIPPVPFFGNFVKYFTFQTSPGYLLKSFYEQSETLPYVGFYVLNKPFLLLRDPEIIKRVLITDFNSFSDKVMSSSKHDNISNKSIGLIDNPDWKHIRGKFASLFTPAKLKNTFQYYLEVGKDLDYFMDTLESEEFDSENLLAQAIFIFSAGYESSATTMSFALYELAKNSDIQTKLRNEITDAIEQNDGKMSCELVVAETTRMYPIVPFIDRKATRDYKIDETGLIIEKGTSIFVPTLGLHNDPKYFPNPEVFDPENFSHEKISSRNSCVYLSFGIGPRNCIGMTQGILQMKVGIAHIISRFEVNLLKDTSVMIDPKSVVSSPQGGVFLNVRKINT